MRVLSIAIALVVLGAPAARADSPAPTPPNELIISEDGEPEVIRNAPVVTHLVTTHLDGAEFYRLVGREDLAAALVANQRRSRIAKVVGFSLLVPGAIIGLAGRLQAGLQEEQARLLGQNPGNTVNTLTGVGLGLAASGFFAFLIAARDPEPVDLATRRSLAEQYNNKITQDTSSTESAPPAIAKLSLTPLVSGGARGLGLQGAF